MLELCHQHATVVIYYADRVDSSVLLGLRQPPLQHLALEDQSVLRARLHLSWAGVSPVVVCGVVR